MESFETYRAYLFSVAYRMLGSAMDAEDMVQETFIRFQAAPPDTIRSLKAYLTTIITRLCMDQLQLARRKREMYVGPWLPEPIHAEASTAVIDPEERVEMEESLSLAFLVLLEQLQPFERAVFLLREVFGYEFAEIADMLAKSEAACRRSFSRARQHIRERRPRFPASHQTHRQLLESYFQALEAGEMDSMMQLLTEDVTLWTDGGGKIKTAALRPITGRSNVARFSIGTQRFLPPGHHIVLDEVNGEPALIVRDGEHVFSVVTLEADADRIRTIWVLANPDKLAQV